MHPVKHTVARPAGTLPGPISWGIPVAAVLLGTSLTQDVGAAVAAIELEAPPSASRARVTPSRDPVLEDLLDGSTPARRLALPADERRRLASMEDLEDTRLERCRSANAFEFDQCFFFGSGEAIDVRRPLEGTGIVPSSGRLPARERSKIPTW